MLEKDQAMPEETISMFRWLRGFYLFLSAERGLMLFMISMGAALLVGRCSGWLDAVYLGFIGFCGWSCVDAINNIFDVELDKESDPFRSEFTTRLGSWGLVVVAFFLLASISLGLATNIPLVTFFILLGLFLGVAYSVPPLRLRQTIYKPLVNNAVGAIPVMIASAFYNAFTLEVCMLSLLLGLTTAVNSLWEDLADYSSDLKSKARTILILLGYCLIPLTVLIGFMFELGAVYYIILAVLMAFMSLHILQNIQILFGTENKAMFKLGSLLARDFVIIAVVQTTNLMFSSYLKYVLLA